MNLKNCMKDCKMPALFVGGALFATAGIKILTSRDAKNLYAQVAAAGLRVKDCVMKGVSAVRENVDDIMADAQDINEAREMQYAVEMDEDTAADATEVSEDAPEA